jgi:hypothetical protein
MLVIYNDLNPSSNSISYKRLNKPKAGPGLGPTGQKQTFVPDQTGHLTLKESRVKMNHDSILVLKIKSNGSQLT